MSSPLLSVLACFAEGETKAGASELRVKESDRLSAIELMLKNIGVEFDVLKMVSTSLAMALTISFSGMVPLETTDGSAQLYANNRKYFH